MHAHSSVDVCSSSCILCCTPAGTRTAGCRSATWTTLRRLVPDVCPCLLCADLLLSRVQVPGPWSAVLLCGLLFNP
jgi:hypothetical protein